MTVNKPTPAQKARNAGYEPGSQMSTWSAAKRRAYNEWLKQKNKDNAAYERGLGAKDDFAFKQ